MAPTPATVNTGPLPPLLANTQLHLHNWASSIRALAQGHRRQIIPLKLKRYFHLINPHFLISLPRKQDWQSSSLVAILGCCCLKISGGENSSAHHVSLHVCKLSQWKVFIPVGSPHLQDTYSRLGALHWNRIQLHKWLVCLLMGDRSKTAGNYWTHIGHWHKSQ